MCNSRDLTDADLPWGIVMACLYYSSYFLYVYTVNTQTRMLMAELSVVINRNHRQQTHEARLRAYTDTGDRWHSHGMKLSRQTDARWRLKPHASPQTRDCSRTSRISINIYILLRLYMLILCRRGGRKYCAILTLNIRVQNA